MISIVICSINPSLCEDVVKNITDTIGIPHEIIVFDNREKKWGIARVYNHCASDARYPFLCFVHEDILIQTINWGEILTDFATKTPNCGLIGCAGGTVVPRNFVTWGRIHRRYKREHLWQRNKDGSVELIDINPQHETFSQTITVDGFFLFVKKSIWQETPFDEQHFYEFHFYDADFAMSVSIHHKNYICFLINIQHFSIGSLNQSYCRALRTFRTKWVHWLPKHFGTISKMNCLKEELNSAAFSIDLFKKNNIPGAEISRMIRASNATGFIFILYCYKILIKLYPKT